MLDDPRLLVVDDEEVICEGCRRIFSRQGFAVEKCSDARQGLSLAQANNYSAILLDIKMPTMDGIEFLEALRKQKADVPVVLMTGYPSIPNAASAIRLGASDYVTKPFTPEEISQAVHRLLHHDQAAGKAVPPAVEAAASGAFRFLARSWYQPGNERAIRTGVVLTYPASVKIESVRLPRIGEVVYQGLPMAAVNVAGKPEQIVCAPLSGVIVAVNEALDRDPSLVLGDPCGKGWIACISATRMEDEPQNCLPRRVLLFNPDDSTAAAQADSLRALGCEVRRAADWDRLSEALEADKTPTVILDGPATGDEGPAMAGRINTTYPAAKIVVVASPDASREALYRLRHIFYYAVEPFADNEIAEILDAAFHPQTQAARNDRRREIAQPLNSVSITNRKGTRVRLLASPGLLRREEGLGRLIHRNLVGRLFPMESSPEELAVTPMNLVGAAASCDRLIVLTVADMGRIPGSLVRDAKGEFVALAGKGGEKIVAFVVQPAGTNGATLAFDPEVSEALAGHLVREMANC